MICKEKQNTKHHQLLSNNFFKWHKIGGQIFIKEGRVLKIDVCFFETHQGTMRCYFITEASAWVFKDCSGNSCREHHVGIKAASERFNLDSEEYKGISHIRCVEEKHSGAKCSSGVNQHQWKTGSKIEAVDTRTHCNSALTPEVFPWKDVLYLWSLIIPPT